MTATYLNTKFGYDETAKIVKEAYEKESSIKNIVIEKGLMSEKEFDEFFDYTQMIKPMEAKDVE